MTRVANPPFCRAAAGAIAAALARRPGSRRLLRGGAITAAALSVGVLALAGPAAQASARAAAVSPYTFSRIAWTGSDEVIAATDNHGALYYFWQAAGTTTWHKQLVAGGGCSTPSIAWTGQEVFIATVTAGGYLVSFTKAPGASAWTSALIAAPDAGAYQAPSVTASTDGAIMISAYDTSGELDSFTQAPGGVTWTLNIVANGTFGPSSITTVYDSFASAYLGLITASSGGTLYFWWEFRGTGAWDEQTVASPGSTGGWTGGSIATTNTAIMIAAATTTGAVAIFAQPIGGSGWPVQTVSASGGPYTNPQIAWTGPTGRPGGTSYDIITAANSAGTLSYWWKTNGSGSWNPQTVAANGTNAVYAGPGIAITSTAAVITAINTKPGNLMYWWQAFATIPWHKQLVATG